MKEISSTKVNLLKFLYLMDQIPEDHDLKSEGFCYLIRCLFKGTFGKPYPFVNKDCDLLKVEYYVRKHRPKWYNKYYNKRYIKSGYYWPSGDFDIRRKWLVYQIYKMS